MKKKQKKTNKQKDAGKKFMSQQSQKVVQVTQVYCNETWPVHVLKHFFYQKTL